MILDQLSSSAAYESMHPLFPAAFAYLRSFRTDTEDGKYPLQGDDLVAIVQRYRTAPSADKLWEAHRTYGDIQVVYSGLELCGHADQRALKVTRPYDAEKDVEKYAPPESSSSLITLGRGNFAVFLPQDGHQPSVIAGTPSDVLKVVIKFRLNK
jgi:YhcH/YjgK/YiaL family protein